jgi:hypothetical protein
MVEEALVIEAKNGNSPSVAAVPPTMSLRSLSYSLLLSQSTLPMDTSSTSGKTFIFFHLLLSSLFFNWVFIHRSVIRKIVNSETLTLVN